MLTKCVRFSRRRSPMPSTAIGLVPTRYSLVVGKVNKNTHGVAFGDIVGSFFQIWNLADIEEGGGNGSRMGPFSDGIEANEQNCEYFPRI